MATLTRFLQLALLVGLLLLAAVAVPYKIFSTGALQRVERLGLRLEALRSNIFELHRETAVLRREIDSYRTNPDYVERIARDELGMVAKGEVIYQFPQDEAPARAAANTEADSASPSEKGRAAAPSP